MIVYKLKSAIKAEIANIAADKSITHRAAMFSLLSDRSSEISNYLLAQDTLHTLQIVENLGADVTRVGSSVKITPPKKIISPNVVLECGNSGTAMRLFMGLLAANDGFFVLSGDRYLNARPMKRVALPLINIGATILGKDEANYAPICIQGAKLKYFEYDLKIASAQVKSALILAALQSNGAKIRQVELSRDHSENMLKSMGLDMHINGLDIDIKPLNKPLNPLNIEVANDPSSAFFFAVAACIVPNSHVVLKNILLNKTRIEAFKVLERMGANIDIKPTKNSYESIGDISVKYSELHSVNVSENISWLIDEAPALAIAFACAKGKSKLSNAKELKVKESDRINAIVSGLQKCGVNAVAKDDGFEITGCDSVKMANVDSYGDHRIAMSFAILGLKCGMKIDDTECIKTSFPNFWDILKDLGADFEN